MTVADLEFPERIPVRPDLPDASDGGHSCGVHMPPIRIGSDLNGMPLPISDWTEPVGVLPAGIGLGSRSLRHDHESCLDVVTAGRLMPNIALISVFLCLFLTGTAVAQNAPPPGFAALHDSLALRPEQEQAWQSFRRATEASLGEVARQRQTYEQMDSLNAPQRIDLSIQLMRSDLRQLERRGDAMKAFYATLSPEQKTIFDRETLPSQ